MRKHYFFPDSHEIFQVHPLYLAPSLNGQGKEPVLMDLYLKLKADEMMKIAHQPQDFIMLCKLGGFENPMCRNYTLTGGTVAFSPVRGVCYSINSKAPTGEDLTISSDIGRSSGLKIILNIECKRCQ